MPNFYKKLTAAIASAEVNSLQTIRFETKKFIRVEVTCVRYTAG